MQGAAVQVTAAINVDGLICAKVALVRRPAVAVHPLESGRTRVAQELQDEAGQRRAAGASMAHGERGDLPNPNGHRGCAPSTCHWAARSSDEHQMARSSLLSLLLSAACGQRTGEPPQQLQQLPGTARGNEMRE